MKKYLLYVLLIVPIGIFAQQITEYEYWYDDDFASKIHTSISSPSEDVTVSFQASVSSLLDGLHHINIRFKDESGKWSAAQTDYFIKSSTTSLNNNKIVAYEYWFDDNYTTKVNHDLETPATDAHITSSLNINGLEDGLHHINIRFKDESGKWSAAQTDYFIKSSTTSLNNNKIVAYEYWLDGNYTTKVNHDLETPSEDAHITASVDVSSLTEGYHYLSIRFKDEAENWSAAQTDTFKYCSDYYQAPTIFGDTMVCEHSTLNLTAASDHPQTLNYFWEGPNNFTSTGMSFSISNMLEQKTGTYSCYAIKGNGLCDTSHVASVEVSLREVPQLMDITGDNVVCQGESGVTYTVPENEYATEYVWTLPTGASGSSSTNSITVDFSTTAVPGNLKVYGRNVCGDGAESTLALTVNPLPGDAGTIVGDDFVCQGQSGVTYNVPVITNTTQYVWTLPTGASGMTIGNNVTLDFDATAVSGDITVYGHNICGNGAESTLALTVSSTPEDANAITGETIVCQGQSGVTYTVPTIANATEYVWTLPTGVTGMSTSNSITVDFGATAISGDITVLGRNTCGDGAESTLSITVNPFPEDAGSITGETVVCQGQNGITYSVPTIANATEYIWTLPTGATGMSTSNSITVDFGATAVSGDITVLGRNTCGDGVESTLAISVDPIPGDAGTITGETVVCQGQNGITYSVPVIANATEYVWTLPTGVTGMSTSNSITVDVGATAVSGDIAVLGRNACGDGAESTLALTVSSSPENAGSITGETVVCQGQNGITYSVPVIANATEYVWTLPTGATGMSTSNSITVDFGATAVSGDITVLGRNTCGDGVESTLAISVNLLPDNAGTITGETVVCQGQNGITYSVPVIANATEYVWTLPTGVTGMSTSNSITVDFGATAVSGDITVLGRNICGDGVESTLAISVNLLPDNAGTITGETVVCQGQNGITYSVPVIANATEYVWTLPTGVTGMSTSNSITVDFGATAVSGDIAVLGRNACGDGAESTLPITVGQNNISVSIIESQNLSCFESNDGYATAEATGGTEPYTFYWSNESTNATAENLSAQIYYVTVTDNVGCSATTQIEITQPEALSLEVNVLNDANCGNNNGEAEAIVTGGTPPYSYLWSNSAEDTSTDTLESGTNSVMVTDNNGCLTNSYFDIDNSNGATVTIENLQHVSCFGGDDGSIEISVSGSQPTILWSTGETTPTISNLQAASYQLTVTDQDCNTYRTIEVTQPDAISFDFDITNANCGASDGALAVSISGGQAPYTETWSDGPENLPAGTYTFSVTDDNGCMYSENVSISNISPLEIIVDSISPAPCGSSGAIYISVNGTSGSQTYNWNNGLYSTEDLPMAPSGAYNLVVTDGACVSILDTLIPNIPPQKQEICVVTVDESTGNNLVVWEKEETTSISHYNIYRETSVPGEFTRIDSVLYDDMSEYSDIVANPRIRSWRYKISAVDNCENESELSTEHKTIHLTINMGLGGAYNLIWDHYEGFPYQTFYIKRRLVSEGWVTLDALPNTLHSYTDIPPENTEGLWYAVTVDAPGVCIPTSAYKANGGPYYQSISNLEDDGIIHTKIVGLNSVGVKVYPNPNNGTFVIELSKDKQPANIKGFDIGGHCIYNRPMPSSKAYIDISQLSKGVYLFKVIEQSKVSDFRVIVQ